MSSMKDRMQRGQLYDPDDPQIAAEHARAQRLTESYNRCGHHEQAERRRILEQLLGRVGDGVEVKPPFRCDFGTQIALGDRVFVNYDCIMLDVAPIELGADCQLASRVQLLAGTHPVDPAARRPGWPYGAPIALGENVWLGGGVIVCPGVTIGAHTVVGAGSIVTRDLPSGVVAVGVPARVQREIGEPEAD